MATTTTNTRVIPAPAPIFNLFSRIISAFERSAEKARIREELETMSGRELADLGLNFSDINDVAAGTYRRG